MVLGTRCADAPCASVLAECLAWLASVGRFSRCETCQQLVARAVVACLSHLLDADRGCSERVHELQACALEVLGDLELNFDDFVVLEEDQQRPDSHDGTQHSPKGGRSDSTARARQREERPDFSELTRVAVRCARSPDAEVRRLANSLIEHRRSVCNYAGIRSRILRWVFDSRLETRVWALSRGDDGPRVRSSVFWGGHVA